MEAWNDFYTMTAAVTTPDGYDCTIWLHGDHAIYRAHFPDEPITPGACVVRIAEEALGRCLGRAVTTTRLSEAKFLAVVRPDAVGDLTLTFTRLSYDDNGGRVRAALRDASQTYARLAFDFKFDDYDQ